MLYSSWSLLFKIIWINSFYFIDVLCAYAHVVLYHVARQLLAIDEDNLLTEFVHVRAPASSPLYLRPCRESAIGMGRESLQILVLPCCMPCLSDSGCIQFMVTKITRNSQIIIDYWDFNVEFNKSLLYELKIAVLFHQFLYSQLVIITHCNLHHRTWNWSKGITLELKQQIRICYFKGINMVVCWHWMVGIGF